MLGRRARVVEDKLQQPCSDHRLCQARVCGCVRVCSRVRACVRACVPGGGVVGGARAMRVHMRVHVRACVCVDRRRAQESRDLRP